MSAPETKIAFYRLRRTVADACYAALRLSGWLVMTTLASLGVGTLLFLAIGDFTALGFFSHLGNLSNRFVAADDLRRAAFVGQMRIAAMLVFAATAMSRWSLLLAILLPRKGVRHD